MVLTIRWVVEGIGIRISLNSHYFFIKMNHRCCSIITYAQHPFGKVINQESSMFFAFGAKMLTYFLNQKILGFLPVVPTLCLPAHPTLWPVTGGQWSCSSSFENFLQNDYVSDSYVIWCDKIVAIRKKKILVVVF